MTAVEILGEDVALGIGLIGIFAAIVLAFICYLVSLMFKRWVEPVSVFYVSLFVFIFISIPASYMIAIYCVFD